MARFPFTCPYCGTSTTKNANTNFMCTGCSSHFVLDENGNIRRSNPSAKVKRR